MAIPSSFKRAAKEMSPAFNTAQPFSTLQANEYDHDLLQKLANWWMGTSFPIYTSLDLNHQYHDQPNHHEAIYTKLQSTNMKSQLNILPENYRLVQLHQFDNVFGSMVIAHGPLDPVDETVDTYLLLGRCDSFRVRFVLKTMTATLTLIQQGPQDDLELESIQAGTKSNGDQIERRLCTQRDDSKFDE